MHLGPISNKQHTCPALEQHPSPAHKHERS